MDESKILKTLGLKDGYFSIISLDSDEDKESSDMQIKEPHEESSKESCEASRNKQSGEPCEESEYDIGKKLTKESNIESSKMSGAELSEEQTAESIEESTKEPSEESYEESTKEAPEESTRELCEESIEALHDKPNEEQSTEQHREQSEAKFKELSKKSSEGTKCLSKESPEEPSEKPSDKKVAPEDKEIFSERKRLARTFMKPLPLNIRGFEKYECKEYQHALQFFKQAAEVDPVNINALQHSRTVYKKLHMKAEADETSKAIEAILGGDDAQIARAKSLAELVVGVTCLTKDYDHEIICKKLSHAIELAEGNVDHGELAFWKLCLAKNLFGQCQEEADVETCTQLYSRAITMFSELANSENSPSEIKAYSLSMIGSCIHRPGNKHVIELLHNAIKESQVLDGSLEPEDYFTGAYALDPASPFVCYLYALFLTRSRRLAEAQAMIKNIFDSGDQNVEYLEAYAARGELHLKIYIIEHKDKKCLEQAIRDLSYYSKFVLSDLSLGQLGSAYHLLLMHDNPLYIDSYEMNRALACFDKSLELQGDSRYTQTHFHHAQCLVDFGYIRLAVESSKRTIENDDGIIQKSTFFMYSLMKQMVHLYRDEGRPDYVMSEIMYWMNLTCSKYKDLIDELRRTMGNLHYKDQPVMVRLYWNLLHSGYEDTAALFLQLIPGFSTYCPFPPKDFIPPPVPSVPYNHVRKAFDFVVLHSASDRPWVYYSLLTKLEMQHRMKGYVIGREMEKDVVTKFLSEDKTRKCDKDELGRSVSHLNPTPGDHEQYDAKIDTRSTSKYDATASKYDVNIQTSYRKDTTDKKHEPHITDIIEIAIENSVCVILIMTKVALQSLWFQDSKPCELLRKVADAHNSVIALTMEEELNFDQFFSDSSVKEFECWAHVPWQALAKHIKLCYGDSPEDLRVSLSLDALLVKGSSGEFE